MQTSDDAPGRVTPDLLTKLVAIVDVDDLERSTTDAWSGDAHLAGTMSGEFGSLSIPIVKDGEVVFGWDAVAAEQSNRADDGRMMVVDITDLDWPKERVWALVAGLHRQRERTFVDQAALAELLLEIQADNPEWLLAAGWSGDDITDLLSAVEAPSLDDLDDANGPFKDEEQREFWPWVRFQVSPTTYRRWQATLDDAPGRDDCEKAEWLLDRAVGTEL